MYWWNYKKLAEALRNGTVKPWQLVIYYLFFLFGGVIGVLFYVYLVPEFPNTLINNLTNTLIPAVVTLIGLGTSYWINASGDNKDYLKRLACLSLPIVMRAICLICFPLILSGALFGSTAPTEACFDLCAQEDDSCHRDCFHKLLFSTGSYIDIATTLLYETFWLYMILKAFRIASTKVPA